MSTRKIYKIVNLINNKIYIGKTIKELSVRFNEHITTAKRWLKEDQTGKKHPYESRLYPAMNKYGYENFVIYLVEELTDVDTVALESREQYWIAYFNTTDDTIGYNISPGGLGGPLFAGHHHSEEMKQEASIRSKANIKLDSESILKRKLPCTNQFQELITGDIFYATDFDIKPRFYEQNITDYKIYRHDCKFYVCLGQRRNKLEPLPEETRLAINDLLSNYFDTLKLAGVTKMHLTNEELYKDPEYIAKLKVSAKKSAAGRQKAHWDSFIAEHNINVEEYKENYYKYKNSCPNQHLVLIYNLSYSSIRGLNAYLGLFGGKSGHKHGKVSI